MKATNITIAGKVVTIKLDTLVTYNKTLSAGYVPGVNEVQDLAGTPAAAFYLPVSIDLWPNGSCTDLLLSDITATSIRLDWINASTDETAILIQRRLIGGTFATIHTGAPGLETYTDETCEASTEYEYRVVASRNGYLSDYSNVVSGTTISNLPAPYQFFNPANIATVNSNELVDSLSAENLLIMNSRRLASIVTTTNMQFPQSINLDQNWKCEFYAKKLTTSSNDNLHIKGVNYGIRCRFVSSYRFQTYVTGTTKTETRTDTSSDLSTTANQKVIIERVSNIITISFDGVTKATINLTDYGSINDNAPIKLYPHNIDLYDFKWTQNGTLVIDVPFAEGFIDPTATPYNKAGNNPTVSAKDYSLGYQDLIHHNFSNGCSLYIGEFNAEVNHYYLPYISGAPQSIRTNLEQSTGGLQELVFSGHYDPYSVLPLIQKFKFKTNGLGLTNNIYFDAGGAPKTFTIEDALIHHGKIFVNWQDEIAPRIKTFTDDQSANAAAILTDIGVKPIELWILAGQSNATPMLVKESVGIANTYMKGKPKNRIWNIANSKFRIPFPNNFSETNGYSVAMAYANVAANPTWFINRAQSNSSISQTVGYDWNINSANELYALLLADITAAIAWINSMGLSYVWKGFIWMQGEANTEGGAAFITNTKALFAGVRSHISYEVPIYMYEVCPFNASYATVRAAQATIANETDSCILVTTETCTFDGANIHLTPEGRVTFAQKVYANLI